jgi:phosphoribosylglycinamide formyltransferase-1
MKNVVCLASGRGSNLQALLEVARNEGWAQVPGARVAAVVCNEPAARALQVAQAHGVPAVVVDHRAHPDRAAFDAALRARIDHHAPDLVVLAGFMRVLTPGFVAHYAGRLLNIHPSLLPAFPGLGTHRQALAAGVRVHGATVHFVSAVVDAGAIVAQSAVPVLEGDSEDRLAARVLAREHVLLPRCVRWILEGRIALVDGRVRVDGLPDDARAVM